MLNTWNIDPLPMLQSMDQRLDGLVRRNVENIRWSMLQNLNISFAGFARRIKERLDETLAATKGAMEAARERRKAHDGSIAAAVADLNNHIDDLEKLKAGFITLRSGSCPAVKPPNTQPDPEGIKVMSASAGNPATG